MSTATMSEARRRRAEAYRLLAACFCLPDRQALLVERVHARLADALEGGCAAGAAHALSMASAVAAASDDELACEHARLFVGPFELGAAPYGSVYRDPARQLCGRSTVAVAAAYERTGLRLDPSVGEIPDHIAIELEFMQHLLARELAAREQGTTAVATALAAEARAFLVDELLAWAPRFAADLEASARIGYYRELGRCLARFLATEAELVAGEAA